MEPSRPVERASEWLDVVSPLASAGHLRVVPIDRVANCGDDVTIEPFCRRSGHTDPGGGPEG